MASDEQWPSAGASVGSPIHGRPVWVYAVFGVYVFLAVMVTFGPFFVSGTFAALIYAAVLLGCGCSLLLIPIGKTWPRPGRPRRIWAPLIGSSILAALVVAALGLASHELIFGGNKGNPDAAAASGPSMDALGFAVLAVWLIWLGGFGVLSRSVSRERLNSWMYKTLLAGSVLELLVAIPMHMIVRRRDECCAGMMTGLGIGVGLIVMLIALGPAVFFLFFQRYQKAYRCRPERCDRE